VIAEQRADKCAGAGVRHVWSHLDRQAHRAGGRSDGFIRFDPERCE
jgi:hypothetical protein